MSASSFLHFAQTLRIPVVPSGHGVMERNVIQENPAHSISEFKSSYISDPNRRTGTLSYFILTILGFSFWFFMVVPFASHRESYSWLAGVSTETFVHQFSFGLSSTYRPLSQVVTWLGFLILDPHLFPTSGLRQALLQGLVYGTFVLAWWQVYSVASQRRVFAALGLVTGCVFFSGYVQLLHIYGLFYSAVVLTLGALLRFHASGTFAPREVSFAAIAILLALWHPYATALFVSYYFGFYVETFRQRSWTQHLRAAVILFVATIAIVTLVVLFPRNPMPPGTRLYGLLVSYQTNEVNRVASLVAFLLAQITILGMELSRKVKVAAFLLVSALSIGLFLTGLPLLLLWPCAVLVKLFRLRQWSLFFLTLAAALLPFGGGIGTPVYVLFAIIVSTYVTSLGWPKAEQTLSFFKPRYAMAMTIAAVAILLLVRAGVTVPLVTSVAAPLLGERERTYQLESILAWLHKSEYCGYEIAFIDKAGSPIEDVESAIVRRNRPPADLQDVRPFWDSVLRCPGGQWAVDKVGAAIVTFDRPVLADASPVFVVKGRYAGDARVWIKDPQK